MACGLSDVAGLRSSDHLMRDQIVAPGLKLVNREALPDDGPSPP